MKQTVNPEIWKLQLNNVNLITSVPFKYLMHATDDCGLNRTSIFNFSVHSTGVKEITKDNRL